MSACDISFTIPKKATVVEVENHFKAMQKRDRKRYPSDPYSGSFATVDAVRCEFPRTFSSKFEALDYCMERAEKWTYVIAVRFLSQDGQTHTLVAGWGAT